MTLPTLAAFQVSPGSRSVPPPLPPTPPAATPAPAACRHGRDGRCGPGVRPTRPRPPHSWRWRVTWAMANGDSCSNLRQNDTEWNWEGYILCVWHSTYIYVHIIYSLSVCVALSLWWEFAKLYWKILKKWARNLHKRWHSHRLTNMWSFEQTNRNTMAISRQVLHFDVYIIYTVVTLPTIPKHWNANLLRYFCHRQ